MTPKDVAGVFSRAFIVGFFLPPFFVLIALAQSLTDDFLPNAYEDLGGGTQVIVLGGTALLLGLLLLGLNYPLLRLIEGYPLRAYRDRPIIKHLNRWLVRGQERRFDRELQIARNASQPEELRSRAAWRLDLYFPEARTALLPTRFGNAVRAFERHPAKRWGLDGIAAWPRVELLIDQEGRDLAANAHSEAAFFVNGSFLGFWAGALLVADEVANVPLHWAWCLVYLMPFVVSYFLYRASVGAATRWGSVVRSAIDIHRLELYETLGVRRPSGFTDERLAVGPAVSGTLLYGYPLPDEFFDPDSDAQGES